MKIDLAARNNGAGLMVYRWEGSTQEFRYDDRKVAEHMTMVGNGLNKYMSAAKIKALYSRFRYLRSGFTGLLAGFVSSFILATTLESIPVAVLLGSVIGIAYVVAFRNVQRLYVDSVMTAAVLGIPLWAFVSVVVFPLISGRPPRWTAEGMRTMLPQLIAWVAYGVVLGLAAETLSRIAVSWLGPDSVLRKSPIVPTEQIG